MVGSHQAHGGYKFSKILVFPESLNLVIGNKCCWLFPWSGRFLVPSWGNACHTSESERPCLPAFLVETVCCENKLNGQGLRRARHGHTARYLAECSPLRPKYHVCQARKAMVVSAAAPKRSEAEHLCLSTGHTEEQDDRQSRWFLLRPHPSVPPQHCDDLREHPSVMMSIVFTFWTPERVSWTWATPHHTKN